MMPCDTILHRFRIQESIPPLLVGVKISLWLWVRRLEFYSDEPHFTGEGCGCGARIAYIDGLSTVGVVFCVRKRVVNVATCGLHGNEGHDFTGPGAFGKRHSLCLGHFAAKSVSQKLTHGQHPFACAQSSRGPKMEQRPRTSSATLHSFRGGHLSLQIYVIIILKGLNSPEGLL